MERSNFAYYNAGKLLKNNGQHGNALGLTLFIKTIESDPDSHKTWLAIGEWLTQLVKKNLKYHSLGLGCLKKAFLINPDSRKDSYSYINKLIDEELWEYAIEANLEMLEKFKYDISVELIVSEYNKVKIEDLTKSVDFIKAIAGTKDLIFFDFLKYVIYNETNYVNRITALKRLYFLKDQIDLRVFFEELIKHDKEKNEPFF